MPVKKISGTKTTHGSAIEVIVNIKEYNDVNFTYSITNKILSIKSKETNFSIYATSGRGKDMNKVNSIDKPFKGPIPIGKYTIFPKELSNPTTTGDILRQFKGDWGDWRVRLHPTSSLKTIDGKIINRDNFFLHGGEYEGSAGCIDIGGGWSGNENTNKIRDVIIYSVKSVFVEVMI